MEEITVVLPERWAAVSKSDNLAHTAYISDRGRVCCFRDGRYREVAPTLNRWKYLQVALPIVLKNGTVKERQFTVHRLVAEKFIVNDDPSIKTLVHHIDENKYNNMATNLMWVSREDHEECHPHLRKNREELEAQGRAEFARMCEDVTWENHHNWYRDSRDHSEITKEVIKGVVVQKDGKEYIGDRYIYCGKKPCIAGLWLTHLYDYIVRFCNIHGEFRERTLDGLKLYKFILWNLEADKTISLKYTDDEDRKRFTRASIGKKKFLNGLSHLKEKGYLELVGEDRYKLTNHEGLWNLDNPERVETWVNRLELDYWGIKFEATLAAEVHYCIVQGD